MNVGAMRGLLFIAGFLAFVVWMGTPIIGGRAPLPIEPTPTAAAIETTPIAATRPTLGMDISRADALVEALGAPWQSLAYRRRSADSFSGGDTYIRTGPDGSATIHTFEGGEVWNVALRSGWGSRCGSSAPIVRAMPSVLAQLAPNVVLTKEQQAELARGLTSTVAGKVETGGVTISTLGTCIKSFDVRTIWSR